MVNQGEQIRREAKQTGFTSKKSTTEPKVAQGRSLKVIRLEVIGGKHLEHQKELFHNFIDFQKAFDRVSATMVSELWQVLKELNTGNRLNGVIRLLYDEPTSGYVGDLLSSDTAKLCPSSQVLFNTVYSWKI